MQRLREDAGVLRGRLDAVSAGARADGQMSLEKGVLLAQNGRLEQENKQLREGVGSGGG